jgi:hypothetical protein
LELREDDTVGVRHMIQKPILRQELAIAVRRALGGSSG